jgi:hypothetical protein
MEVTCSSETLVAFNGLHGIISQKAEFFINTAAKPSNPTQQKIVHGNVYKYFL